MPAGLEAERAGLFLEVGELAARHFMQIDFGCRPLQIAFEGGILVARRFPIKGDAADPFRIEARIALRTAQRLDDRAEAGLRGIAGKRVHRRIDGIDAGIDGGKNGRGRNTRRIMRVEMDRQAGRLAQRLEQHLRGRRFQKPAMSFSAMIWAPAFSSSTGKIGVVFQIVFRPGRIEDIAGIADRRLAELVLLGNGIHRDAHVLDPVQAIEDAEEIDAASGRLADEIFDDIVGIVGVADAVGAAQQHLQQKVRGALADQRQALPRILGQKAHGDVECRAAPAFERQKVRQRMRIGVGNAGDVIGAHAGGEQRLVAVAHRRVGHQHALLVAHPFGEFLRAERIEELLCTILDRIAVG